MQLVNSCITELLSKVRNNQTKLHCVGAGNQLVEACVQFERFGFFEQIDKIFDNNITSFEFAGKTISVEQIKNLRNCSDNSIIYICASERYIELYELLDGFEELKEIDCFIHNYVRHIPVGKSSLASVDCELIPKTIHYCWFGEKDIPDRNRKWMDTWARTSPGFEIVRWDESNYDYKKNRFMKRAYDEKKYAFVSDCARLEIIYENGGIYLDNDVEVLQDLSILLRNHAFCGTYYSVPGVAFGLGFGGERHFSLFKEMFEMYNDAEYIGHRFEDTCLYYQTEILKKYGYNPNINEQQMVKNMVVFSTEVLSPMDLDGNMLAKSDNSVSFHHFDASWYEESEKGAFQKKIKDRRIFFQKKYSQRQIGGDFCGE